MSGSWRDIFSTVPYPSAITRYAFGGRSAREYRIAESDNYNRIFLLPRFLTGTEKVQTDFSLLGMWSSAPIFVAPMAYQALINLGGETATAAAAQRLGLGYFLSTFSSTPYETISKLGMKCLIFQLYLCKDRTITEAIIRAAENFGYQALCVTVDVPIYRSQGSNISGHLRKKAYLFTYLESYGINVNQCFLDEKHFSCLMKPDLSWKDLEWLCSFTSMPIIIKGLMNPTDSKIALQFPNVKSIIISNHGGRHMPYGLSPISIISQHRKAVGEDFMLGMDGGCVNGVRILKALASGADYVLVGQSILKAMRKYGERGVMNYFKYLLTDLNRAMHSCGCSSLADIRTLQLYQK